MDSSRYIAFGALVAASPFYLLTAMIVGFERRNPEDGMVIGFMMLAEFPLWIGLGFYLGAMVSRARLPKGIALGMWLMLPLAALACIWTLDLMGTDPNWMAVAPVLLPIVAVLFGLWARRTAEAEAGSRRAGVISFGAAALSLCLVPAIGFALWTADAPAREAQYAQAEREQAERFAAMDARCASLGPDSPLENYLDFLEGGFCTERARAVVGNSPRRQSDAVRLLDQGALDRLHLLSTLDLRAAPELCRSYARAIDRRIGKLRVADPVSEIHMITYNQITNLGWFMAQGCNLSPQLRQLAAHYRSRERGGATLATELDEIARAGVRPGP